MTTATLERLESAEQIVASSLPGPYEKFFQPTYSDIAFLTETVGELLVTKPVTTPDQINDVRQSLASAREAAWGQPIIVTNECAERVDLKTRVGTLAGRAISTRLLVLSVYPDAVQIGRDRGQIFKPRSNEFQILTNGVTVLSYQGDGTNGYDASDREPDPRRLVAGAVQSRELEEHINRRVGIHVPAGHEALHLAYERSFMAVHEGKRYLLSTDVPWIGWRTNDADGPHVKLLSGIENSVAVKIGANSDAAHIKALTTRLNPEGIPGKLIFMLRLGNNVSAMDTILEAIAEHAPSAIDMFDIHGSTRQLEDKTKVRSVSATIDDINLLASACLRHGRRLRGLHLETHADDKRHECVDHEGERPSDKSRVDPGFNPRQTRNILNGVVRILR